MGKVIYPRKGEVHTAPSAFPAVFAAATWEQVIEACQTNTVPDTWEVGDQKSMTINGTDYLIDIIGKNHDEYSDGSGKAPLTFQTHDCYGKNSMNGYGNHTGWTNCQMRVTHLPAVLSLMPSEVQAGIKEVNKQTSAGNSSSAINTTADKLFLPSAVEVFGTHGSYAGEGTQYAYYSAGNSPIKLRSDGSKGFWWTRSPSVGSTGFHCVNGSDGTCATAGAGDSTLDFAPAFCF